ncbi:M20/M25/M40 family metallo-hydrolase [Parvularcula flava]|uniref:M20/M25/M40 family metallo-hydrolase n=1 Tax=Aquisalinus luteolus TaxID=1566827 RepID=A0A8J3A1X5_9PROT|nr:M20/M25/M40 family metallo-hydrolase [Aquisalinus luteolus]NHK26982.1 M20/M25/M40 family metallo-hydrolase [Aquisalinus luteolus]GGH94004.1 hypothetical protein GCM10011355_07170 [Aquisalinus luteolus]
MSFNRPLALLAILAITVLLSVWLVQPPRALPLDAPADRFSAERALEQLEVLIGDGSARPVGTPANKAGQQRIAEAFADLGLQSETITQTTCRQSESWSYVSCTSVNNILAPVINGEGPAVVLMAHHDSVPTGPGAADDSHGVAIIMEIARILKAEGPSGRPVMALITDGEEEGLLGAKAFFEEQGLIEGIGAVINVEARGNQGPSFLFETTPGGAWMVKEYAAHAKRPSASSLTQTIYEMLPNDTDLTMVKGKGIAGANFAFLDRLPHYHTHLDNIENLSPDSVQHQGENMLAMTRAMIAADLTDMPEENAIYSDLWSYGFFYAPQGWALPLGLLALALIAVAAFISSRGEPMQPLKIVASVFVLPLCALLAAAGGFAIYSLAGLMTPSPGWATPTILIAGLVIAVWASIAITGASLARFAGEKLSLFAPWLMIAAIACVIAFTLPGASVLLLLPALAAGMILLIGAFLDRTETKWISTGLAGLLFVAFIAPVAVSNIAALTGEMHVAMTVPLALAAATLVPLAIIRKQGLLISGGAVVLVLIAAVVLGLQPSYTPMMPKGQNIIHATDYRDGTSQWRIRSDTPLPDELARSADFSAEPGPYVDALFASAYVAEAEGTTPPPAPSLTVEERTADNGRTLVLSVDGSEDLNRPWFTRLLIPVEAQPVAVRVNGVRTEFLPDDKAIDGYHVFVCQAVCGRVWVELAATAQTDWVVTNWYNGLPEGSAYMDEARPDWMTPIHDGDFTVAIAEQRL